MADIVRFTVDHHQLGLVVSIMDSYLAEPPCGEIHNFMHSIIGTQVLGLKRKLLLKRRDYRMAMPVHFALAFRRMVATGIECIQDEQQQIAMLCLMAEVDPVTNRYIHIHH